MTVNHISGKLYGETINDAWIIYHKASIFHYSKNYGYLTLETKFKVEINLGDLPCLFSR